MGHGIKYDLLQLAPVSASLSVFSRQMSTILKVPILVD